MSTGARATPALFLGEALALPFAFPRGVLGDFERCEEPEELLERDFDRLPELDLDLDRAVSYLFSTYRSWLARPV